MDWSSLVKFLHRLFLYGLIAANGWFLWKHGYETGAAVCAVFLVIGAVFWFGITFLWD